MYDISSQLLRTPGRQAAVNASQGKAEQGEEEKARRQEGVPQGPSPSVADPTRRQQGERLVNASAGRRGEQENVTEDGGNVWLKQVLWLPDEALKDEVWIAKDPELFEQEDPVLTANAPPPVIPFIKYASTGPPRSPWTSPDCSLPEFRILSLDGGGVRGILSAVILARLLKAVPTFLDNVDLLAGTSTGGLIAL
ncbi:hypothetical protein GUITHDRAFT_80524, partial [Guillardia theta CCMP2712]